MARFQNKYYKLAAFSSAQNKTKGVLILVNRKLNLTIEHLGSDEKGRFVFIRCKIYNNRLALVRETVVHYVSEKLIYCPS